MATSLTSRSPASARSGRRDGQDQRGKPGYRQGDMKGINIAGLGTVAQGA
jgi:hypothetical protein